MVARIAKRLSSNDWWSTQSTAFGLLAVSRLAEKSQLGKGMSYALTLNGKRTEKFSERAISRIDLPVPDGKASVKIENTGKALLYARLVRTGTPLAGQEKASSSGLGLSVSYTLMDGTSIDPARIEQGTDFMAVVNVTHPGVSNGYQQLALSQLFPSGWEIATHGSKARWQERHKAPSPIRTSATTVCSPTSTCGAGKRTPTACCSTPATPGGTTCRARCARPCTTIRSTRGAWAAGWRWWRRAVRWRPSHRSG